MPTIATVPASKATGAALSAGVPRASRVGAGAIGAPIARSTASAVPASRVPAGAVVALTTSRDYGHIRYAETLGSPAVALQPNAQTPFTFTIDPTQTQDFLKPPFAGALAFDGATITPRRLDDALLVETNLIVTSAVAGGFLRLEIDVGSALGPIGGFAVPLTYPPGQPERVTFPPIFVQVLANFMANGARFFLTATVPVALISEAITLIPVVAAP